MRLRRPRAGSLGLRLLVAYLVPTLGLLALFAWLASRATAHYLEAALGERLMGIAQAAATQVSPESVAFLAPGDDDSRTAQRLRHKLLQLRDRTGVARIFVLDRELRSRTDTEAGVRIGDRHYQAEADRSELRRVFGGEAASSVLFEGNDGRTYKTGYAPVREGQTVVAVLGAAGSAAFFADLRRLRTYLVLSAGVVAVVLVGVTVLVARRISRPLRELAGAATRIGAGELDREIPVRGGDEVGLLARTMNEMRQQLHEREQQLQLMLSGIAHEVRNPLGGIALFAGLLREELADKPEQLEMVQRIERELGYLKNVVGEFLDYARKAPPHLQELDLAPLLEELAQVVEADAATAGLVLRRELPSTPAIGDGEQLRRVVLNLARNAIQATAKGGAITLRCGLDDGTPFLELEDTGSGIAPELLERIFAPFFTTREKGTGLGMALSKKIVDQHGGGIAVASLVGQGTRVRVTLRPAG
ncbi:MAG: HAMP domain-containing histidine kinase [Deltaproteobacteria bacterium]|nr:HAMP domain-containing histidine kinase [Deltaproteobacteria bacterium]